MVLPAEFEPAATTAKRARRARLARRAGTFGALLLLLLPSAACRRASLWFPVRLPPCECVAQATVGGAPSPNHSGIVFAHEATTRAFILREVGDPSTSCSPSVTLHVADHADVAIEAVSLPSGDYELAELLVDDASDPRGFRQTSHGDLPLHFAVAPGRVTVLGDVEEVCTAPGERCEVVVASLGRGRAIVLDELRRRAQGDGAGAARWAAWLADVERPPAP